MSFARTALLCGTILTSFVCHAQYFTSGVIPDGYIDFNLLPGSSNSSTPTNATIPVTGVTNLNVTISATEGTGIGPDFDAKGPTLTLSFNPPVFGIRADLGTPLDRFGEPSLTMDVDLVNDASGHGFTHISQVFALSKSGGVVPLDYSLTKGVEFLDGTGMGITKVVLSANGFGNGGGFIHNVRVQSTPYKYLDLSGQVPRSGLRQWLRADAGIDGGFPGAAIPLWRDQSGSGADASQSDVKRQPVIGRGSVWFQGGAFLNFRLPINGLRGMTIFLVAEADSDYTGGPSRSENAAIFWNETVWWGTTYLSPFQSNVAFRFGSTQVNNFPVYKRPLHAGADMTLTASVKNGSTDSLYVNGVLASRLTGQLTQINGATDAGTIGMGYDKTPFNGRIAEILVYTRALSDAERQSVEKYLTTKYQIR